MKFKDFLTESTITVYHGDNYNTKKLKVNLMFNGNNQEGTGIYFANDISVAHSYGKDIIKTDINPKNFIDSRAFVDKLPTSKVVKLLRDLGKHDLEAMFYLMTDYSIYLTESSEIIPNHYKELYVAMSTEQIRDFQTTLIQSYNEELFIKLWNKYIKLDGTYHKQTATKIWYAIINPNIQVISV